MAKREFTLLWAFEPFEEDPSFLTKRMFGGLAAYVHGRLVMVLFEESGDRKWKGKTYPYDLWNGILFPTEREHHESLMRKFPNLVSHPVLGKWLYQPQATLDFEETVEALGKLIARDDFRLGVVPKPKRRTRKR